MHRFSVVFIEGRIEKSKKNCKVFLIFRGFFFKNPAKKIPAEKNPREKNPTAAAAAAI